MMERSIAAGEVDFDGEFDALNFVGFVGFCSSKAFAFLSHGAGGLEFYLAILLQRGYANE
jgi:hypothetical protein